MRRPGEADDATGKEVRGMPVGRWATVAEAVEEYGVTRQRIHQLMRKGALGETRLMATPRGPVWMIRWPFVRTARAAGYHRDGCDCGRHMGERRCR